MPYNPQSNPVERTIREQGRGIRAYCHAKHTSWVAVIQRLIIIINHTVHNSTKFTPAQIEGKCSLKLPKFSNNGRELEPPRNCLHMARQNLAIALSNRSARYNDKNRLQIFTVGQWVLKRVRKLSNKRRKIVKQFCLLHDGPYKIKQIQRENAYTLQDKQGRNIGTYNARQLRPLKTPKYSNNM